MNKPLLAASLIGCASAIVGCDEKGPAPKAATPPGKAAAVASTHVPASAEPGRVRAMGLSFPIPAGWNSVTPVGSMRLAELQAPDPAGDAAKMCTLVFSTAGGSVESNLVRWRGQVMDAAGKAAEATPKVRTVEGMAVTTIEMTGEFMNMGETTPHANWTLRGSVIETPAGLLFVKMTGPAEQMAVGGKMMEAMIAGLKRQ